MSSASRNPSARLLALVIGSTLAGCHVEPAPGPVHGGSQQQAAHAAPIYLVVYRPGPHWIAGAPLAKQPLREHFEYMLALHRRGVLKWAGPFGDESGGAVAFLSPDDASASGIVSADPAVETGVFEFELRRWNLVDWEQRGAARPVAP